MNDKALLVPSWLTYLTSFMMSFEGCCIRTGVLLKAAADY